MKISISGTPGSGKTTVAKELAKRLDLDYHSIGTLLRELAKERGMDINEISKAALETKEIDNLLDEKQKEYAKEDNFIMDSRLGFHFIPDSVKIFIDCDSEVAAKRIFGDDRKTSNETYASFDEVKEKIRFRLDTEKERYLKYYGIDYTSPDNFDLMIDSSQLSVKEIVENIASFLKKEEYI
ncbi:MAG TPA: AAA family ATPase [Candidatus Woesearchaeota archaeon]|nr:AAA family ATPase [Candidatus Woesearchaeota archaeon]